MKLYSKNQKNRRIYRYMPEYNYSALWENNITVRFFADFKNHGKNFIELPPENSEFYDVSLGTYCPENCNFCFLEDTVIQTLTGKKEIKYILKGEKVYSYNHNTQDIELKNVDQVYEREYSGDIISIELENGNVINCTPNHKIYTKNRGYVEAKDLTEDDELLDYERKCIFCKKDISYLKSNAIICGDKDCTRKYKLLKKSSNRVCEVCGKDISSFPGQRKICYNDNCIKEQKRRKYKVSTVEKECKRCKSKFLGTLKQDYCKTCRKLISKESIKDNFITYAQVVLCKNCKKPIDIDNKVVFKGSPIIRKRVGKLVCKDCKIKSREELSRRMLQDNPLFDKKVKYKVWKKNKFIKFRNTSTSYYNIRLFPQKNYIKRGKFRKSRPSLTLYDLLLQRDLVKNPFSKILFTYPKTAKKRLSFRMRINNPMSNQLVANKARNTLINKYNSREIVKKKGIDHWLWKGNRNFNKAVRIELRNWVKSVFKQKNYTCEVCGVTNTVLHVHHKIPLRDIISKYLQENKLTIEYINSIEGSDNYFKIIDNIVDLHYKDTENIAIVVCPKCHSKLDTFYKRKLL